MTPKLSRAVAAIFIGALLSWLCGRLADPIFIFWPIALHPVIAWVLISIALFIWLPSLTQRFKQSPVSGIKHPKPTTQNPIVVYEDGPWTVVHARPEGVGGGIVFAACLLSGSLSVPVAAIFMRSGSPILALVLYGLTALGIARAYLTMLGRGRKVQPRPFAVGAQGVRLPDGIVIPADTIASWNIANTSNGRTIVMANNGGARAGTILRQGLVGKNFFVEIEHGGRSSTVAGGLTEALAREARRQAMNRLHELQEAKQKALRDHARNVEEMNRWRPTK